MQRFLLNFLTVFFCLGSFLLLIPRTVQAQGSCNIRANIFTNSLDPADSQKYYIEAFIDGSPETSYTVVSQMNSSTQEFSFVYPVSGTNVRVPFNPANGQPQWHTVNKNAVPNGATLQVRVVNSSNRNTTLCQTEVPFSSATDKAIGVEGQERCQMGIRVTRIPGGSYKLGIIIDQRNLAAGREYQMQMMNGLSVPIDWRFSAAPQPFFQTGVFDFDSGYEGSTHQIEFLRRGEGDVPGCPRYQSVYFPVGPIVTPPENATNAFFLPWNDTGTGINTDEETPSIPLFTLCGHLAPQSSERDACESCAATGADGKPQGVYSAIGCVKIDQKGMLRQLIQILLGVSGLIALLSILAGAFLYTTSQGDTNKIKQAKELITASVMGIFFIIFSTIILDFITVQVLRIPGLS